MIKQKKIKIGINGFGRIVRTIFRVALLRDYFDVVAINDLNDSLESLAYLIKYDTIHGTLGQEVTVEDNSIFEKTSLDIENPLPIGGPNRTNATNIPVLYRDTFY